MIMKNVLTLIVFMSFIPALYAKGKVAAKSNGVEVYAEAKKDASVLQKLKKDELLDSLERKGMYWEVKTADGKQGFVSVMKVKLMPQNAKGINSMLKNAVQEAREANEINSGRTRSTVMGVRGLDENSEVQFAGNMRPNMRLVYKMEDLDVPQKRLDALQAKITREIEMRTDED